MAFQPGQSGNPGGRPKDDPRLKAMAQARTEEAFAVVLQCLSDEDARIRLKAAEVILDRGFGKPAQELQHTGDPDNPLHQSVTLNIKGVHTNP